MTETSGLWTTDAIPAGHQVVSYTQTLASDMLTITGGCSGYQGVVPGYSSELAPTAEGGAFTVRIAAGAAMVDGKYYKNTANVDKVLAAPAVGNTRIDRIVVEATWANFECVITVIEGVESGDEPVAPAYPSTPGNNYAILICQALVNNVGDVTITDERTWAITPTDDTTLEDTGVGSLRVKDGGITAAKIANRTRTFVATITDVYNVTDAVPTVRVSRVGYETDNADLVHAFANFIVPQDYASTMTVAPIMYNGGGAGNIYYKSEAKYGAVGEAYDIHETLGVYAALAAVLDDWVHGTALALANAAAGDYVSMQFFRDATNVLDTYNGLNNIMGFLVSYTADS